MSKITDFFRTQIETPKKKRDRTSDDAEIEGEVKRIKRIETYKLGSLSPEKSDRIEKHNTQDDIARKKEFEEKVNNLEKLKGFSYLMKDSSNKDESLFSNDDDDEEKIFEEVEEKVEEKAVKKKGKKSTFTPLELQYMKFRDAYPDTILFVESGYRYRFFGKDAEIASKLLNIQANMSHNFLSGSVPVHRLHVHARKFVQEGYKVGVVSQTETAALKAISNNKNGPFERNITAIYTKSTFIDEDIDPLTSNQVVLGNYLLCIYETIEDKKTMISLVAIQTSTADIIYDTFEDDFMRNELETRLKHISPIEVLLSSDASKATREIVEHMNFHRKKEEITRVEMISSEVFEDADSIIESKIELLKSMEGFETNMGNKFSNMQPHLKKCFAGIIHFLDEFGLEALPFISLNHRSFANRSHMKLSGHTLMNLELFTNSSTSEKRGSLFYVVDQTVSAFGKRLLMEWLKNPLLDKDTIVDRQEAVEEISYVGQGSPFSCIIESIQKSPDLERGISKIYYRKISVQDFIACLKGFKNVHSAILAYKEDHDNLLESKRIKELIESIPDSLMDHVDHFLDHIDLNYKSEDKSNLFLSYDRFPKIIEAKSQISEIEQSIGEHLYEIRDILKLPDLEYKTLLKTDYTIDVSKTVANKHVPSSWEKLSMTKTNIRYHTPFIIEKSKELACWKERLSIEAENAWKQFASDFSSRYIVFRNAVKAFAEIDCLCSLSIVARQQGYVKPTILDSETQVIDIKEGRHPVIESVLTDGDYVPNDCTMSTSYKHTCTIVSGPNMGGKTSYAKQTALICILAQIGSFVPASEASLTPIDAIFTRMGASDNMLEGKSTFFVELQETSLILSYATPRSLAILDELGRGTSTHDGFAIAYATLKYLVSKIGCFVLFITHYPSLHLLHKEYPHCVQSYHIAYRREENQEQERITFLYKLKPGIEDRSFGMNVASLANLPPSIVEKAKCLSSIFERYTNWRLKRRYVQNLYQILRKRNGPLMESLKHLQQKVSIMYN